MPAPFTAPPSSAETLGQFRTQHYAPSLLAGTPAPAAAGPPVSRMGLPAQEAPALEGAPPSAETAPPPESGVRSYLKKMFPQANDELVNLGERIYRSKQEAMRIQQMNRKQRAAMTDVIAARHNYSSAKDYAEALMAKWNKVKESYIDPRYPKDPATGTAYYTPAGQRMLGDMEGAILKAEIAERNMKDRYKMAERLGVPIPDTLDPMAMHMLMRMHPTTGELDPEDLADEEDFLGAP